MNKNRALTLLLVAATAAAGAARAGDLEPPAPPASTMQSLDSLPTTWNQLLTSSARFELVMGGEGVLDKETGLVWEQAPAAGVTFFWKEAVIHCYQREVGGRLGWRLPAVDELASLIDPAGTGYPTLPAGHPFEMPPFFPPSGVGFWTITTYPDEFGDTGSSWIVSFETGTLLSRVKRDILYNAWCVRGGHGYDFAGQN